MYINIYLLLPKRTSLVLFDWIRPTIKLPNELLRKKLLVKQRRRRLVLHSVSRNEGIHGQTAFSMKNAWNASRHVVYVSEFHNYRKHHWTLISKHFFSCKGPLAGMGFSLLPLQGRVIYTDCWLLHKINEKSAFENNSAAWI